MQYNNVQCKTKMNLVTYITHMKYEIEKRLYDVWFLISFKAIGLVEKNLN